MSQQSRHCHIKRSDESHYLPSDLSVSLAKLKEDPSCYCEPGVDQTVAHVAYCPAHARMRSALEMKLKLKVNVENIALMMGDDNLRLSFLSFARRVADAVRDEVISYTWTPYTDTNCGDKCDSVYILDKCKDNVFEEVEKQREMFPNDLKGCPLMVQAVVAEPYVMPPERRISEYGNAYEFDRGGEVNLRAMFERNFAVVSSRRQAEYQNQRQGRGINYIYCFPESDNLYKYGVVLLARKWFPLLERFNKIIRSLTENGLINKWNEELFLHRMRVESVGTIVPLNIQHLFGAFAFIAVMYAASCLVFVSELLVNYILRRRALQI
ncbi:uncharacterized protein [Battus philenor]|uniref:uncharacterized protein n=1 Tax=Battus philenor TaxID=42288 RepID=UPI0035D11805